MRIAFEAPIGNAKFALEQSDYIFAIAPMLKIPEYAEAVKEARKTGKELYIDNGVYEGQLMGVDEYLELCYKWEPKVVVALDVLLNQSETERLSKEFFEKLGTKLPFEVMYVLQGRNFDQRLAGYFYIARHYRVSIIGLGLGAFDKNWRSRIRFLSLLESAYTKRIHLLGAMNVHDLCFWQGIAESVDTSLPFHLAQEGKLGLFERKETKRLDWSDTLVGERFDRAVWNVEKVREALSVV